MKILDDYKNIKEELIFKNNYFMEEYLSRFNQSLGNASSLEQCVLLEYIVKNSGVESILDTGSGISTCFIRKGKLETQIVHTYETKVEWIQNVKSYLNSNGLYEDNIFHVFDETNKLKEEYKQSDTQYDLIYHDMGCIEERIESLPYIAKKLKTNGYIILDDMHFGDNVNIECNLLKATTDYFNNSNYQFIDIKNITIDNFNRFAYMYKKL